MKTYLMSMDTMVEVSANSEEEAIELAKIKFAELLQKDQVDFAMEGESK